MTTRAARGRAGLGGVATGAVAVAVLAAGGLFAFGASQGPRVPLARAEIAHLVAGHRLAMLQAGAAARAETILMPANAAGTAASSPAARTPRSVADAPVAAPPAPVRKSRRYRKFEQ